MTDGKMVAVELAVHGDGVTVRTEGATFALAEEELWQIREEARQAAGGDLSALGDALWRATLGRCDLGLAEGGRVVLAIDEPEAPAELADLPWECMVEPEMGLPVALHPAFIVSRKPAGGKPPRADRKPAPAQLRILFVHPGGGLPFATDLERSLEDLAERGLADPLSVIGEGEAPVDALERRLPHIVHWIVGSPEDGGIEAVVRCLIGLPAVPPLLVLTGADGAALPGGSLPARLLSRLSHVGVEAALSPWRQDLAPFAAPFWAGLYQDLALGETLATAVRRARRRLDLEGSEAPVWLEPAVRAFRPDAALVMAGAEAAEGPGSLLVVRGTPAERPFKGLSPYEEVDVGSFFGREDEIRIVLHLFRVEKRLILHGASGTGKTSLIRAALVPGLQGPGLQQPLYVSRCADPAAEILAALGEPLPADESPAVDQVLNALDRRLDAAEGLLLPILLDQAEDLILYPERKELLRGLLERTREGPSRCALLLALRSDARLWFRHEIDSVYFDRPVSELELRPLTLSRAGTMLDRLSRLYGFDFDAGLKERLLADLSASPDPAAPGDEPMVLLPQLSLVLDMLYERRQRSPALLLLEEYDRIEIERLLPDQLRQVQDLLDEPAARMAPQVEIRLVDTTTRRPVARSPAEIAEILGSDVAVVSRVIEALLRRHLLHRFPDGRVQLVHEILARSICDEHLDKDLAEQDAVRGLLRAHLSRWLEAGEPLPPEVFARAQKVAGDLDLPLPELGLYVGSLVESELAGSTVQDPLFQSLSIDRIAELAAELRSSSHPRLLALSLLMECKLSPARRKPAVDFQAPLELQPASRFLSEALLPVLARHGLGIPAPGTSRDQREIEENRTAAFQILTEPDLLRRPISGRSYQLHLNLVRTLCGRAFRLLTGKEDPPLRFWPGPWAGTAAILVAAVLLSLLASWLLWPRGGQSPADLGILLLVSGAVFVACGHAVEEQRVLHVLGSSLVAPGAGVEETRVRVQRVVRLTIGTLAAAGAIFSLINMLVYHSSWLHHSFFTVDTWRAVWAWITGFPETGIRLPGQIAAGIRDFFYGIPLLGTMLQAIVSLPDGSTGLWWFVLRVVSLLLAAFVGMGGLSFALPAAGMLPGAILLPPGLVAVLGCVQIDRLLSTTSKKSRGRRASEIAAVSLVTGLVLPGALWLSHAVLTWVSPHLWAPEVFYGERGMASLAHLLERLGREPIPLVAGVAAPLGFWALVRWLGDRRFRFAFVRGRQSSGRYDPQETVLRPLFAEGTEESLRLALYLVRKWPSVRGEETFSMLFLMALEEPRALPAALGEKRQALADQAQSALLLWFDSRFWQPSYLPLYLREMAETATGSCAVRARLLLVQAEQGRLAAAKPPPTAGPSSKLPRRRFSDLVTSILGVGISCALLYMAPHGIRVLGGHLIDIAFPLDPPMAPPLSDVRGSLVYWVRLFEFIVFPLLVLFPFVAMIVLPRVLRKRRHRFQAGGRP